MANEACQVEKNPLRNMFGGHFANVINNSIILLYLIMSRPARIYGQEVYTKGIHNFWD
jgi:hypothetical protein